MMINEVKSLFICLSFVFFILICKSSLYIPGTEHRCRHGPRLNIDIGMEMEIDG